MMFELCVTIETAKLAKEKGFDEPCNTSYLENGRFLPENNLTSNSKIRKGCFSAPTQALLQKWLREVHSAKLYCVPSPLSSRVDNWTWMIDAYKDGYWNGRVQSDSIFDTYEQSLEKGLQQALRYINVMKTGVIIGRFQSPYLHEGHKHVIDTALKENDLVAIYIGHKPLDELDDRNPYTFAQRAEMVKKEYPQVLIGNLEDVPNDDATWSLRLDMLLSDYLSPTLYGSRDSFHSHYKGIFPYRHVEEIPGISATQIRENLNAVKSFQEVQKIFDKENEETF